MRAVTTAARRLAGRSVTLADRVMAATDGPSGARPTRHTREDGPEVTVVVTTRERPALLSQALASVSHQAGVALECVVVDDGSSGDATATAVAAFASVDRRIRFRRHPLPLGLAAARNTGVAHATAPLICFLDDDDHLCPSSLARRAEALTRRADVTGVYCDWRPIPWDAGIGARRSLRPAGRRGDVDLLTLPWGAPFIATAPLVQRAAIVDAGGFNEALDRGEDAELWLRLCRAGHRFGYVRHVGVTYRMGPATMVSAQPAAQLDRLLAIGDWLERPADRLAPGPCPEPAPLSVVRMRHAQLPQILRYLALLAADDHAAAVERARALIPATLRSPRALEPHRAAMVGTLTGRSALGGADGRAVVDRLLAALSAPTAGDAGHAARSDGAGGPERAAASVAELHRAIGHHPGALPTERARLAWSTVHGAPVPVEGSG
jgi:hypothetical protein